MKFVLLLACLAVVATVSEASSTETAPTVQSTTAAANTGTETTNPANTQTTAVEVTTQRNGASSVAGGWSLGCVLSFGIVVHLLH
jgi:cytoskeletal protein RodZ